MSNNAQIGQRDWTKSEHQGDFRGWDAPALPSVLKRALQHSTLQGLGPQPAPSLGHAVAGSGCREEREPGV